MTMIKKYIEDKDGNQVLPFTHFSAVKDSDGNTLEDVLYTESTYDPTTYSGMGRKVLQKNMVGGVNILTQDMMPVATGGNTIYIIRYDFTLGEDITIPDNCVLQFDGGSISGEHTIIGANTGIQAGLVKIFSTDVTLAGTWNVKGANPEWFGAIGGGIIDDTTAIRKTIDSFQDVLLTKTKYKVTSRLNMHCGSSIRSNDQSCILFYTNDEEASLMMGYDSFLYNLKLFFSASSNGVVIDDEYLRLSKKENRFNIIINEVTTNINNYGTSLCYQRKYIDNCHFCVIRETITGLWSGKTGLTIKSRGTKKDASTTTGYTNDISDTGMCCAVFSNISFSGEWYRNLDINASTDSDTDDIAGWLTDLSFENVFFHNAYNNIWIHKDDQHTATLVENFKSPICVKFINCGVQHVIRYNNQHEIVAQQSYFCKMDAGHGIQFIACEIWDWDDENIIPLRPFYIDLENVGQVDLQLGMQMDRTSWVELSSLVEVNYSTETFFRIATPYKIKFEDTKKFTGVFEKILQIPDGNGTYFYNADIATIPDGKYLIGNINSLEKLGCKAYTSSTEGLASYLEKVTTKEGRITLIVSYRDTTYGNGVSKREMLVCDLGSEINSRWTYKGNMSSALWQPITGRYLGYFSNANKPTKGLRSGDSYYDITYNKMFYWLYRWVDDRAFGQYKSAGTTADRPQSYQSIYDVGYEYYDRDLSMPIFLNSRNNSIYWKGANGYTAAINRGTTSQRPTGLLNETDAGFMYYDTTINKPIWLKVVNTGTEQSPTWVKSWVDATGTSV